MKSYLQKMLLILALGLLSFSVSAQKKGGYSLRVNFDGAYTHTPNYDALVPYSAGLDLGWVMHENLTLYAGLSYWQADHSTAWGYTWYTDYNNQPYDYYWESPMVSLLVNASAKFNTPAIKLRKGAKLCAFIEPGISIEPVPMAAVSYERIYPLSYYSESKWDTEYKFSAPYFFWNVKGGLSYVVDNVAYAELAYTLSNLDMYKIYRNMDVEGTSLSHFIPKEKLLNGLRFTLGVYIDK